MHKSRLNQKLSGLGRNFLQKISSLTVQTDFNFARKNFDWDEFLSFCFNFTYFSFQYFSVYFCVELQISDVIKLIKDNLKFITAEQIEDVEVFELLFYFFFFSLHLLMLLFLFFLWFNPYSPRVFQSSCFFSFFFFAFFSPLESETLPRMG